MIKVSSINSHFNLKDKILSKISEEDIFSKYIPGLVLKKNILSPLRDETTASFNVYKNNQGKLLFKDFGGEHGDCFYFVMLKFNVNFHEALDIISNDFNLSLSDNKPLKIEQKKIKIITKEEPKVFEVSTQYWNEGNMQYWNKFNINLWALQEHNIHPVTSVKEHDWSKEIIWDYTNPIYMFIYNTKHKFYRPYSKKLKHFGNTGSLDVFGLEQLTGKHDTVVLCAGQKDVLSLYCNTNIRGVSLNSESCHLDNSIYLKLREHTDNIVSCYDNDKTGKQYSWKLWVDYGIPAVDISNITDMKDISEYIQNKGDVAKLKNLILSKL